MEDIRYTAEEIEDALYSGLDKNHEFVLASDYDALAAECDELQRRLDAVVKSLKPDGPPIPGGMFDKEVRVLWRAGIELHTKARAIAEGRAE